MFAQLLVGHPENAFLFLLASQCGYTFNDCISKAFFLLPQILLNFKCKGLMTSNLFIKIS